MQKKFGTIPKNELSRIRKLWRFGVVVLTLFGRLLLSSFFEIENVARDEILKIDKGNIPHNLFYEKLRNSRLVNQLNSSGIFPPNSICDVVRITSNERLPREGKIFPFKLFTLIRSCSSISIEPNSTEIFPIRLFHDKLIIMRLK